MDTVRYFRNFSKTLLRNLRDSGDTRQSLQHVQHHVAVDAGYASWSEMLAADESDRRLAAVMLQEPLLNYNGIGKGPYPGSPQERRERFRAWRVELRSGAEHVEQVRIWLEQNIEPRKTVNPDAGSYGLKHIVEDALGKYVSNGELIAAAIIAGFPYQLASSSSPNVSFGMRAASIKAARAAAYAAREARMRSPR